MVDMAALPNPYTEASVTLEVAAACLGMSRTTAWRAVKAGRFPVPVLSGSRVSVFRLYGYLGKPLPPRPPNTPRVITLHPPE
jgi:predicted DNA-binding transcriptional regulator AlpA